MAQHFRSSERQGKTDQDVTGIDEKLVSEIMDAPLPADVASTSDSSSQSESDDVASMSAAALAADASLVNASVPVDDGTAISDVTLASDEAATVGITSAQAPHTAAVSVPHVPVISQAAEEEAAIAAAYSGELGDAPDVPHNGTPTISMRGVSMVYPAQPNKAALEDVNVDIYPGEFVFIVGHSGSGKSTFIRLLTRELRATAGKVLVAGQDLTRMRNRKVPYLRRQLGCVFQDFKLLPDKTTYENVAFALECIGKPKSVIKAQVPEVLRLVGLNEKMDNYPDQLSGGEQQRVAVARAMVNRPPLLVCDEPTGNLDPAISLGIMKLLDRINRAGTTVVMATHDREMVDSMRKRVIALEAGHVVRDQERGGYGYYV